MKKGVLFTGFFAFFLGFFFSRLPSFGQSNPYQITPTLQEAYADVFKLKVTSARALLQKEKNTGLQKAFAVYVEDYADMVTLLVSDEKRLFEQLSPNQDKRLAFLEELPPSSPYQRLYQAEIRLHWAFIKLKFGKEVSACWDIIKAYRLLEENAKKYPDFISTYKSLGMLHVLIGSAPQNYQWVTKLLGLRGNIPQGMREIKAIIQKDKLFGPEARLVELLLHAYILTYTEPQNAALLGFVNGEKDNLLLHFFGTTISMKDGRGEQALKLLNQRPVGSGYLAFPFLEYLKGEILLQKGQYDEARTHLKRFLAQYKGQNYLKDTHLKLFLSHWLEGEEAVAMPYLERVLTVGTSYVEADKFAEKFAKSFRKKEVSGQQKALMKARLAFDGGYLQEAASALKPYQETFFTTLYDKAEFHYRWGRTLQRQNRPDSSIVHYERAIALSQAQSLYFGATSALQLGYMYQAKGNNAKAIYHFKQALNYPKHEYKNSVDNKARAALTLLGVE
ncbi:tetratricopeptide repeat protein [Runella sp. CRIBMP]|uniref:tetratricopeptide repeat protein n=1 Tax=Runella sp. CRIBMP TaxID=2683261 RepID=UPI001412D44A|nr:tetratricopeptide repeat protein [Runella sp. CRIBMP]NBB19373.1 tetratricopeptide repeat protein [Runella sp. CRIBMP]